ncbi:MAG TPA: hypothetical protein H9903_17050 [Candidatus Aquabacterium excrementipullorum]|nr:hypothetical protein [Candidatus Aquabacterium excrementipullorum]
MKLHGKSGMALALALQLLSVGASAQQLLSSPGFETGGSGVSCRLGTVAVSGQLDNQWGENSCWITSNSSLVYALDPINPHSGLFSQSVESSAGAGQFWTPVALNRNKKYTASIWLRANQPMVVQLQLRPLDSPYTNYGSLMAKVTTAWQQFTFDAYGPAVPSMVPGGLFVLLQQSGKLWVDDASVTAVTDTTAETLRTDVVPKTYFGMHIHRDPTWPTMGGTIGSYRLWDTDGAQWADIYPINPAQGGTPDWAEFDARLNAAIANGAEPVVVLGGNIPNWASSDPRGLLVGSSLYGAGSSAPPVSEAVWVTWVTAVAQRAKGKVKHWEIWNEPYQNAAFRADVSRLVRLAQLAYPILKNADADNKVLSPSFDAYDNGFLERYLQAGGGAYMDIVSLHAYDDFGGNLLDATVSLFKKQGDPESAEAMYYKEHLVRNTKVVLTRYNQQAKPVWNTEGGYQAKSATGARNDVAAAPVLARNLIMGWAFGGIDRNFFYSWDHRGDWVAGAYESVQGSNVYVEGVAGKAYEQVAKWLTGAQMESRSVDSYGTWTIVLNRGTGSAKQYLVWNPRGNYGYAPPTGTDYVSYVNRLDGTRSAIPSPFTATPSPVLLTRN